MLLYRIAKTLFYLMLGCVGFILLVEKNDERFAALLLLFIPVCLLLYWLQKRLWLRANRNRPVVCIEATLVNHRQQFSGRGMRYEKSFLTFVTATGKHVEFEVSQAEFDRIQIGAKGPLEYRGSLYVSFRKPAK